MNAPGITISPNEEENEIEEKRKDKKTNRDQAWRIY